MKHIEGNKKPWVGVSHNPEIIKQVFIEGGIIPNVTIFGKAILNPGQFVVRHIHPTMYEIFYILGGKATFTVSEKDYIVGQGDYFVIEPGEEHSQKNNFLESVSWIYFGIAVD